MAGQSTLLAIGAHYDDCVYGVSGTMLKAVEKHYRVVQLILIGDYSNWPPAKGREREFTEEATRIAGEYGIETRLLEFASHRFEFTGEVKRQVASAVFDINPDIAFQIWEDDYHHDHTITSQLSKVALHHGSEIIGADQISPVRAIYQYGNGPSHTVGFEPDTYVDITDCWDKAQELLSRYAALALKCKYDPKDQTKLQLSKATLAGYRGSACGVRYAEAFLSSRKRPVDIF